jgi:hypothetical protein
MKQPEAMRMPRKLVSLGVFKCFFDVYLDCMI